MKYTHAFEIARIVLEDRVSRGERFRANAVREVALAGLDARDDVSAADAMERAVYAARISINPAWDGSIA